VTAHLKSPPLWFGVLWLAFGAPFLLIGMNGLAARNSLRYRFAAAGETVVGTVIRREIARSDAFTRTYWIDFRYVTREGRTLQSHARVDEDSWYRLTELGPIQVRYLRAHPERRAIAGEPDTLALNLILGGLGALFGLIGLLLLGLRVASAWRRGRRAGSRGSARPAAKPDS